MNGDKLILFLLRVSMGWIFLYSGITKILNPNWSAEGFIRSADAFSFLFVYLLNPDLINIVTEINRWGQLFLGISLILGIGMYISTILGAVMVLLYYMAGFKLPLDSENSFLIDVHIIYILVLLTLRSLDAGSAYGLKTKVFSYLFIHKHRVLAFLLR